MERHHDTTAGPRIGDRHVFQFGALGGMPPGEFRHGSERVSAYLRRYGSTLRRWDPPPADDEAHEAEWGFDSALLDDLERLAERQGWRLRHIGFDHPEDLSPLVANLYRWWYGARGRSSTRLLVESFVLVDPYLTLRTGSVPYWSTFGVDPSAEALERYLDRLSFDEIRIALFSHGTDGVGVAPADRWQAIAGRARRHGELLGVDPGRFPADFGSFGRFHRRLRGLGPMVDPPGALTVAELEAFLADGANGCTRIVR